MATLSKYSNNADFDALNKFRELVKKNSHPLARDLIFKNIDIARYVLTHQEYAHIICDNSDGSTYAHFIVKRYLSLAKEFFNDKNIMMITSKDGWSVYHQAARWHLDIAKMAIADEAILSYSDNHGNTIANLIMKLYQSSITANESNTLERIINAHRNGTLKRCIIASAINDANNINTANTTYANNEGIPNVVHNPVESVHLDNNDLIKPVSVIDTLLEAHTDEIHLEITKTIDKLLVSSNIKDLEELITGDNLFAKHILDDEQLIRRAISIKKYLGHKVVELNEDAALHAIDNQDIAAVKNNDGWSIAHQAVLTYRSAAIKAVSNYRIGSISDEEGITVMQIAVQTHLDAAILAFKLDSKDNAILSIENDNYENIGQIAIIKWGEIARMVIKSPNFYTAIIVSPKRSMNWTFGHEAAMTHLSAARRILESKNEEFKNIFDKSGKSIYDVAKISVEKHNATLSRR